MLRTLTLAALLAVSGATVAGEIRLFENENFAGNQLQVESSTPKLDNAKFGDRAYSVQILSGQWQLCSDPYFHGSCVTLGVDNYGSLIANGLRGGVASVRERWDYDGRGASGGGQSDIVLYDSPRFGGSMFPVPGDTPNLDGSGFNDRAQSAIVYNGTWELCEDADYRGACQTFGPGRYPDLGSLDRRLSSLRQGAARGGGGLPKDSGNWGAGSRAALYEGPSLTGRMFVIDQSMANLDGTGFNDRAQSLRIEAGYWIFCSDANFQGDCRTFGPGDYPTLPPGLSTRISSGRRISNDYPYQQDPKWGGK